MTHDPHAWSRRPFRIAVVASLTFVVAVAGCQTYREQAELVVDYPQAYQALADCAFLAIESEGRWRKEDFPSMGRSRLTRGNEIAELGRIDFIGTAAGGTRVEIRHQGSLQGRDAYPERYRAIIDGCAGG